MYSTASWSSSAVTAPSWRTPDPSSSCSAQPIVWDMDRITQVAGIVAKTGLVMLPERP